MAHITCDMFFAWLVVVRDQVTDKRTSCMSIAYQVLSWCHFHSWFVDCLLCPGINSAAVLNFNTDRAMAFERNNKHLKWRFSEALKRPRGSKPDGDALIADKHENRNELRALMRIPLCGHAKHSTTVTLNFGQPRSQGLPLGTRLDTVLSFT